MFKRKRGIPVNKDRNYLEAENTSYDKLVECGYFPQGMTKDFEKVVVFRIENEKKDVFYFDNWQEAMEALCS